MNGSGLILQVYAYKRQRKMKTGVIRGEPSDYYADVSWPIHWRAPKQRLTGK